MLTTRLLVCGIRAIIDRNENRTSLIDIFEEFTSPAFPLVLPRVSFLWLLHRDDLEENVPAEGLLTWLEGDVERHRFPVAIDFQCQMSTRSITLIGGLSIMAPGRITVRATAEGMEPAEYQFDVGSNPQVIGTGDALPEGATAFVF